jgi:trehalose 6-phosphate phosphatase
MVGKIGMGCEMAPGLATAGGMSDSLPPPPPLPLDAALLLDFDGTLVELADLPEGIEVPATLGALLARIAIRLDGRVALVSGRSVADLERHAGPLDLAVAGSHGVELRFRGGAARAFERPAALDRARGEAERFAADHAGLLIEDKPAGFALHFRGAAALEERVCDFAAGLAERSGLTVQHGKMVVELLPRGIDKGEAVRRIMREPPFAGASPWFVGDDLTDEHGFAAAAQLGGDGILVGPPRETAARWSLGGVGAVLAWLEAAAG